MHSFEMAFLAIASKNRFMTQDEAAEVLTSFNGQPNDATRRSLEQIIQDTGLLTSQQIKTIATAAAKFVPTAVAPPPRPPSDTQNPKPPANPNEPIPGIKIVGKLGVGGTATVFEALETSTSQKRAPFPRAKNIGVPPTERNARTGELTPAGMTC